MPRFCSVVELHDLRLHLPRAEEAVVCPPPSASDEATTGPFPRLSASFHAVDATPTDRLQLLVLKALRDGPLARTLVHSVFSFRTSPDVAANTAGVRLLVRGRQPVPGPAH